MKRIGRPPIPLAVKFWRRVGPPNAAGCTEWTGPKAHFGYGKVKDRGQQLLTHRVAYELAHGVIPAGMCVLHTCDNPACVNPRHLRLGTLRDNNADRDAKGRTRNQHTGRL